MQQILIYLFLFFFCMPTVGHQSNSVHISVMTFNIENGGTQVDFTKVVEAIKKSDADVVGIQEAWGNIPKLAKALAWKFYDQRQHIISRYPLYEAKGGNHTYLFIEVLPGKMIAIANIHLPDEPYGIDLIKAGKSISVIEENEKKIRLPIALPFIRQLALLAKNGTPVFLTGDFNAPSHLDLHKFKWPVSEIIAKNNLKDSYREIFPDPAKHPGYTWPAARPILKNAIDNFNPTKFDVPVRIDFIFTGGNSRILESHLVGEEKCDITCISVIPWPSDHRALVSRFDVTPVTMNMKYLSSVTTQKIAEKPALSTSKKMVHMGEAFYITWHNAPGNRYDYISLSRHAENDRVLLYTRGEMNGSIKYDKRFAKGNWLDWSKSKENHWPLKPGVYDIKLILDDSNTELASTQITVVGPFTEVF